jgi:hypothetical protein
MKARPNYLQPGDAGFSYASEIVREIVVVTDEGTVRRESDGDNIAGELKEDGINTLRPILHISADGSCRHLLCDLEGRHIAWIPIKARGREAGIAAMVEKVTRILAHHETMEAA